MLLSTVKSFMQNRKFMCLVFLGDTVYYLQYIIHVFHLTQNQHLQQPVLSL